MEEMVDAWNESLYLEHTLLEKYSDLFQGQLEEFAPTFHYI